MVHLVIAEDTDRRIVNHVPWRLPKGIRRRIEAAVREHGEEASSSVPSVKEAYDHAVYVLGADDGAGIGIQEMKRMKHWFETHAMRGTEFDLYGGMAMMHWVDMQLEEARNAARREKEAARAAGASNAFKREHDCDRQTSPALQDDRVMTYNPATAEKRNALKELTRL